MDIQLYLAFVTATVILIAIPGPNVALIIASGLQGNRRQALMTVAGVNLGLAGQLALAVLGMSSLMLVLADWFEWLRWAGVAYLIWLGVQQWRQAPAAPATADRPGAVRPTVGDGAAFGRGFAVSVLNPKTLLFHAAFLPQFVDPTVAPLSQLALLGVTFLAIGALLDGAYAVAASRAARAMHRAGWLRWANRLTGGLLIGAGIGLALARRG